MIEKRFLAAPANATTATTTITTPPSLPPPLLPPPSLLTAALTRFRIGDDSSRKWSAIFGSHQRGSMGLLDDDSLATEAAEPDMLQPRQQEEEEVLVLVYRSCEPMSKKKQ